MPGLWKFGALSAANFSGDWATNSSDATIAHEFGHLVRLPDEYVDLPGQAPDTSEEYSVTLLQYADDDSIMADLATGRQ